MSLVIKNEIGKITRERVTTAFVVTILPTYRNLEEPVRFNIIIVNLPTMKLKVRTLFLFQFLFKFLNEL